MGYQTLEQQAHSHNNDYADLEVVYYRTTSSELVKDPYSSVCQEIPLTLSASVVIPAWNARGTILQCLLAIEQSSFNRKYPEQLEVVVVDDGSTDGTWELLERMQLGVRLKAVRQAHHSRSHTQNTGIAVASGDIIISCDADMILTPFSIEELVKRHQMLEHVMLIGFRGDVQPTDPRIHPDALPATLPQFLPPFTEDIRLSYGGGWPESMCRYTDHLKRFGKGKYLFMPDGNRWDLANMIFGALFSLRRSDFIAMDGYDERFYGWGCEDTLVGVRALAMGTYILPIYSAAGLHVTHADRSRRKWQEYAANRRIFQTILRQPFLPGYGRWLPRASTRICGYFEREPLASRQVPMSDELYRPFVSALADPDQRGKYLYNLGRYDEAAAAFSEVQGETAEQQAWVMFDQGKALRAGGRSGEALPLLTDAAAILTWSAWPEIELALTLAALGQFAQARQHMEHARKTEPGNSWAHFILSGSAIKHLERAQAYARQDDYHLAIYDYEAALIHDPCYATAHIERVLALTKLGQRETAVTALTAHMSTTARIDTGYRSACIALARTYLESHRIGAARMILEQAMNKAGAKPASCDQEVIEEMNKVQALAALSCPIPLARDIARLTQSIPGWFGEDEAELLIALVLKVVARRDPEPSPALIEIGSYCGRATITMGLTLRALERDDVRIISVDEPSIGRAPDGGNPRDTLHALVEAYGLEKMMSYAPEEANSPWEHSSALILVDGRHDYAGIREDVERYAPRLVRGGFLLFHDYADYCPDVRRYANELLLGEEFEFVAQTGTLMVLQRRREAHAPPCGQITFSLTLEEAITNGPRTIWLYWEGTLPRYIMLCCKTIAAHNQRVVLLNRASFDILFQHDRDINIDALAINHLSDFVRAYLLKYYGGLYVDADCIAMRDFSAIWEKVEQYGFVGYREHQGNMSCAFMASKPHSTVITEHYNNICATLRSKRSLSWLALASIPLDEALAKYPDQSFILPTTMIMPVNWSQSETFCVQRSDEEHEHYLEREALCYMLSNETIRTSPQTQELYAMSDKLLLHSRHFIAFLFRKSFEQVSQEQRT